MTNKSSKPGPQQNTLVINLEATDSLASYYVNYMEVSQTPNDFTIYGARIPAKLTPEQLRLAQESGTITVEADLGITFPTTISQG